MVQRSIRSLTGVATTFQYTQVVNLRATTNKQLLQVLKKVEPGSVYVYKPIALVETQLDYKHRQKSTLKAVVVSPTYWDSLIDVLPLATFRQIHVHAVTADFLFKDDMLIRILPRTAPRQDRYSKQYEIVQVDDVGQIDLKLPFVDSTLEVDVATPTVTFPSTGLLQFSLEDVGKLVAVSFVTQPIMNVIKIIRTHEQATGVNIGVRHAPYAYVMHPSLANVLSIPIPII